MSDINPPPTKAQESDAAVAYELFSRFIVAAHALDAAWDRVLDHGYPRYLPSFDEFLDHLSLWEEAVKERRALAEDDDFEPVDFTDPVEVRKWIKEMRGQVEDAVTAGEDATRPLGKRGLGRLMARRMVIESRHALLQLLKAGERGLG